MKKIVTVMKIIAVSLVALAIGTVQARAAVTVYADEVPSNNPVAISAPLSETNGAASQTEGGQRKSSGGGDSQVRIDETGVHIGGPDPVDINTPASFHHHGGGTEYLSGILAIVGSN